MAEVITRFRVNVNGVEQDARVCYQNLANKPTFKTINGKAIVVSEGDTETNLQLATNTQVNQVQAAVATAQQEVDALAARVDTNKTDITNLKARVSNLENNGTGGGGGSDTNYDEAVAEANIYTDNQIQNLRESVNSDITGLNERVEELEDIDLNNYYKKTETYNRAEIDTKIASAGTGGSVDLSNYYTKNEVEQRDTATYNNVVDRIENSFVPDYTYNKSTIDEKATNAEEAAKLYADNQINNLQENINSDITDLTGRVEELENNGSGGGNSENSEYAEKLGTPDEYLKIGEISDAETGETYPAPILISNDTEIVVATEHILTKFTTLMQQMFSGEIDSKLASELDNYYDKTNTDLQITSRLANYYDKSYVDTYYYTKSYIDNNYCKKSDTYSAAETDEKIDEKIAATLAAIPVAEGGAY